jgi:nucleotide-binding universal stress UspA family protein
MTFKTLMVHLKLGHANSDLLRVAVDLAGRFDARMIGIAAAQPAPMIYTDGYAPGAFVEEDRAEIDREIGVAEAEFVAAFAGSPTATEWRSATIYEAVADYIARECRSADLVITSGVSADPHDTARTERPGDVVMQAGRPVLVVPRTANTLKLENMVVAWKNTREARRAIADALPLLSLAKHISVLELAHADERGRVEAQLLEICDWLGTHSIGAEPLFVPSSKGDDAYQLDVAVERLGGDVVIAGAYGHSRLREWALGGVTRDLTLQAKYCTLLSH